MSSEPYVGQIEAFGFNYAPQGWAFCDGSLLQIDDNGALFQLIGTTYGGDGQTTFAVPDFRGRAPVHAMGFAEGLTRYDIGQKYGAKEVTLTGGHLPAHDHTFVALEGGTNPLVSRPSGNMLGGAAIYSHNKLLATVELNEATVGPPAGGGGGSTALGLMKPYLAVNWCISLYGTFPQQQ